VNRRHGLGRILAVALLAAALAAGTAPPAGAASSARASYQQALARERALTARGRTPTVGELRLLAAAYERITRQYPTSGYADNALWQAAQLMLIVHGRTKQESDLQRAIRLMTWLVREYPSSSLRRQARLALADAEAAVAAARRPAPPAPTSPATDAATSAPRPPAGTRSETRVAATVRSPSREAPAAGPSATPGAAAVDVPPAAAPGAAGPAGSTPEAAAEPAPSAASGTTSGTRAPSVESASESAVPAAAGRGMSSPATLRDIRRTILPDVVRVTLELDREVAFHDERLEDPLRIFLDLQHTAAPSGDIETIRTYADDVVRQVRVGPRSDTTTRVVLDLDGGGRYSIFTLYNPYRIVVDVQRPQGADVASAATRGTVGAARPAALAGAAAPAAAGAGPPASPGPHPQESARAAVERPPRRGAPPDVAPASARGSEGREAGAPTRSSEPSGTEDAARETAPASVRSGGPAGTAGAPAEAPSDAPRAPLAARASIDAARPPATPSANSHGGYSLARQLGLGVSRIVIDPGHGGHDPGALGRRLTEADLVLDVALRLEKLLLAQPGFEVVLTRRTDTFVPLEERTAIANRAGADLFLSIHANASRNRDARGVETYYLNFATNTDAAEVAARENSASERSMHHLADIVKAIALNNKLDESRDFAQLVQGSLVRRLRAADSDVRDLGVKQAPFVVLIGAGMPSVLAEISFVTHAREAQLLRTAAYRQRIAEALFDAIVRYQNTLKATRTTALQ
jgi:N-acetylmuramoyl-L-alanine amidase